MMKIIKWVSFCVWILCITIFTIGQFNSPSNYHLIPGNPWGKLFGVSVMVGIISFILTVILFVIDPRQKQHTNEKQSTKSKYNFSPKRLISRLILTGIIGIIFGIAMFPFMTIADGLLYEQRAAIGGQNILKMVILWGIFTAIVSLFAFWKKKFRMVGVLLIFCWIISLVLYSSLTISSANDHRCHRPTPYSIPKEFSRSLDLISQRVEVDKEGNNNIWQAVFNFRNCLNIQYADKDNKDIEAYFEYPDIESQDNLQDLKIVVNPSYKNFDDLTLATLLSHEIVHAGQYILQVTNKTKLSCYEKEAKAFLAQHAFIVSLNQEEQRSIYARLREDIDKNPTLSVLILTGQRGNESAQACSELQKKNKLTLEQVYKCSWEGLENKLLEDIKDNSYYQKQCQQ